MIHTVKDRFLKYVQFDTQADPYSDTSPSSAKQLALTQYLSDELSAMGVRHQKTEHGYIYAYLDSNVDTHTKKVMFCAHIDTAPDCSGTDVRPLVHEKYDGKEIILPDDPSVKISPENEPNLGNKIGHDIITASGHTLLGSDDKSGVAIIMDTIHQLCINKDLLHGDVRFLFTTDEEIGRGVKHVDLALLDADFGYTLDGGHLGTFENENFSAQSLKLIIKGVSAHPGYAKGKMENAIKIASEVVANLPKTRLTPESTHEKEGFVHPTRIEGNLEDAAVDFILRDFSTAELQNHRIEIEEICKKVMEHYPNSKYEIEVKPQYLNMKEFMGGYEYITDLALQAMKNQGIEPILNSIRGGTDGAMLSAKGLPCPNLFSGQNAIHSKKEWVSVQDMESAVKTVLEIINLTFKLAEKHA